MAVFVQQSPYAIINMLNEFSLNSSSSLGYDRKNSNTQYEITHFMVLYNKNKTIEKLLFIKY